MSFLFWFFLKLGRRAHHDRFFPAFGIILAQTSLRPQLFKVSNIRNGIHCRKDRTHGAWWALTWGRPEFPGWNVLFYSIKAGDRRKFSQTFSLVSGSKRRVNKTINAGRRRTLLKKKVVWIFHISLDPDDKLFIKIKSKWPTNCITYKLASGHHVREKLFLT